MKVLLEALYFFQLLLENKLNISNVKLSLKSD